MATTFAPGSIAVTSDYPVSVTIADQPSYNRLFAVPMLGALIRGVLLIPHLVALYIVAAVAILASMVASVLVLVTGEYPGWAFGLTSGTVRWFARVQAYFYGLTDAYPPFGLGSNDDSHAVQVVIERPSSSSRLYAVPVVGLLIRELLLIPHLIVIYALGAIVGILQLFLWAPVLFGGQYPDVGKTVVGGYIRWVARVVSYLFGLTDKYPPFSFSN